MRGPRITLSDGHVRDARRLHRLIVANQDEGHLLPRTLADLTAHADRFVVARRGRRIVGCAELAPLSPVVAEIRSLAVDAAERHGGIGRRLVDELRARARRDGYEKLSAFTHSPAYFIQMGFSIVPHLWVAEKVFTDCVNCAQFRRCGQYAMVLPLDDARPEATGRPVDACDDVHDRRLTDATVDARRILPMVPPG